MQPQLYYLSRSKAFGNKIAFQLENLERYQRTVAEKLISDIIYYARLGKLTEMSSISTAVNPKQAFSTSNFMQPEMQPRHFQFDQNHHPLYSRPQRCHVHLIYHLRIANKFINILHKI